MKKAADAPYILRRGRVAGAISFLGALSILLLLLCCALGSAGGAPNALWQALKEKLSGAPPSNRALSLILFEVRLPRCLTAYAVGAALSVSGVCMQGVFKNPMADPHLLGVSSGAALGAAAVMVFGLGAGLLGSGAIALGAFAGGVAAVLLVLFISRSNGRISTLGLLLSGIAVSTFLTALLSGLLMRNHEKLESVYLWTLGSFASAGWQKIGILAPVTVLGAAALRLFARDLNAMLMGEEEARTLGVSVARVRMAALGICTLLTATAVSFSGVIGFVGLMVPHAVRLIVGPDHRATLPVSFLSGGIYLMLMDTLARTLFMPVELPVGVLTALVGGPFFLILLKRARTAR